MRRLIVPHGLDVALLLMLGADIGIPMQAVEEDIPVPTRYDPPVVKKQTNRMPHIGAKQLAKAARRARK